MPIFLVQYATLWEKDDDVSRDELISLPLLLLMMLLPVFVSLPIPMPLLLPLFNAAW